VFDAKIFAEVVSKGVNQPLLSRYIYQDTFFFKRNICRFHRSEVSDFKGSVKPAESCFTRQRTAASKHLTSIDVLTRE
jgi:hypothetical protein